MIHQGIGFIGGGRVARIFLSGWQQANPLPNNIVVSDPNAETLAKLKTDFPVITTAPGDNRPAAAQSVVFLAVHPPVMMATLAELRGKVSRDAMVVSLAPKITLARLAEGLSGHEKLARMIPNAPSILGAGYNPMAFSGRMPADVRQRLKTLLAPLGECPEVTESKLEAYALITGMGPTYLWFQLETLRELGRSFGLTDADLTPALKGMVCGSIRTLLESGLSPVQVLDLIPVKPLAEDEAAIKAAYQIRLPALFAKIKP